MQHSPRLNQPNVKFFHTMLQVDGVYGEHNEFVYIKMGYVRFYASYKTKNLVEKNKQMERLMYMLLSNLQY